MATIIDEFTQAWALSMLSDPTENPQLATPNGLVAWIGMKKLNSTSGASIYSWTSNWSVMHPIIKFEF